MRPVSGVRRAERHPDRARHQGSRRDRRNPGAPAPDVRRRQPRGHLRAALLRDRTPGHRGAGLPGDARRPARHGHRGAGRAHGRQQAAGPGHELAEGGGVRGRRRRCRVHQSPYGDGCFGHHRPRLARNPAHRSGRHERRQGGPGAAHQSRRPDRQRGGSPPRRGRVPRPVGRRGPRRDDRHDGTQRDRIRPVQPRSGDPPQIAAKYASVVATGRSDFPNQINNVLAFPGCSAARWRRVPAGSPRR